MKATGLQHVVFCADRRVLPGLHVAAFSLLDRTGKINAGIHFHLFSDDFTAADFALLEKTLNLTGKAFILSRHWIDPSQFAGFSLLNGSLATYYRLLVPQTLDVERFLYVDADTLCDIDVTSLHALDLDDTPVAWVPEAPLAHAVDRLVAEQLGNGLNDFYFNAGVALVNVPVWRSQRVTEDAMCYLKENPARCWDQSALNYVLHGRTRILDGHFNCIANVRCNWEVLRRPYGQIGRLAHFLDYPKPWDFGGEIAHPQYALWNSVLARTALKGFKSWQRTPARRLPRDLAGLRCYKKAMKDRFLFAGYTYGLLRRVKGVPPFR